MDKKSNTLSKTETKSAKDKGETVLDDMLTPIERNVKTYLTETISQDIVELLALLAIERPDDPHLWLAQKLLERSETTNGHYYIARKDKLSLAKTKASLEAATATTYKKPDLYGSM